MNLQPINPSKPEFVVGCFGCGQRTPSAEAMADLDGPAFRAFYCRACQHSVICNGEVQS